jgi:hypothetical protein
MLEAMDPISGAGGQASPADVAEDMAMLKQSQDMAKENAAQLLAAMPPPPKAPSPPGVGGRIDITA